MKSKHIKLSGWLLILVVMVLLTLIAPGVTGDQVVQADSPGGNPHPRVLPLNSKAFGKSYAEWSVTWWQWALGIPADRNPLVDTTGEFCGEGQSGKVWFLGGTFNESGIEDRDCTVPLGKAIFFPLVNAEADEIDTDFLEFICGEDIASNPNEENLTTCVEFIMDQASAVTAIVDGENLVSDKDEFRVLSPPFFFDLPEDDILGLGPAEDVLAVSDGFWVLLAPLPKGEHSIVLGGTLSFTETLDGKPFDFEFTTEVTYNLTVE